MKVQYEGMTYSLTSEADFTSGHLDERLYTNYKDAAEGEGYAAELSATAEDDEGNEYRVYWIFVMRKGEEPDLDDLDFSNPHKVVYL